MATPWNRISEEYRAYLEAAGHSADEFNEPSFKRTEAFNAFSAFKYQQAQQQQKQQQLQQDDSLTKKRRMDDLLSYHNAVLETGTSKSSKLLKVRKTADDSKLCFLCGSAGTATNKIEASHILQKQDIYATGGEDALHTFDILKGWTNGHGWSRPFKIHDPMNLIWLCHSHNLAFDSHCFGLALMALDNSVGFCSYDRDYDDLVKAANQRLQDETQTFYDMSYVSRRAVGMRLFKAQECGHYLNHKNPGAWEAIVRLSAAASVDQKSRDSEEDST